MKISDIPVEPILRFLAERPDVWHNNCFDDALDVHQAMPPDTPENLVHAAMNKLIGKGLVDGCTCGCRGDYEITQQGIAFLAAAGPTPAS